MFVALLSDERYYLRKPLVLPTTQMLALCTRDRQKYPERTSLCTIHFNPTPML